MSAGQLLAAPRDAVWFNKPQTRSGHVGKFHVFEAGKPVPLCGRRTFLSDDIAVALNTVALELRCKHRGCAVFFEAATS
jgi:hypothetical protein